MMKNATRGKRLKNPKDMMRLLATVINKILLSQETDSKAGTLPSLSQAWLQAYKAKIEADELADYRSRLAALEKRQSGG